MITWLTELHLTCDTQESYDCHKELILDQLSAKTKAGMYQLAKKAGWFWDWNKKICLCPECKTDRKGGVCQT